MFIEITFENLKIIHIYLAAIFTCNYFELFSTCFKFGSIKSKYKSCFIFY